MASTLLKRLSTPMRNPVAAFPRSTFWLWERITLCNNGLARFLATESAPREKQEGKKEVVFRQEEQKVEKAPIRVKWDVYKRSWKHIQKIFSSYQALLYPHHDTHEGRKRRFKHDHIVYYFRKPTDLEYWYIMTDEDGGGHSWAELKQGPNEMTAIFRGYLNQQPPQEFLKPSAVETVKRFVGTAFLETKPFFTILDKKEFMSLDSFNCFKIRLRGDGRRYLFEMVCDGGFEERVVFFYPIHTRGGPLWEVVEIPYMKFFARREGHAGFILKQRRMDGNKIENFRFLINDGIEGPFQLEIDYIALTHNPGFAYETTDVYNPWEPINSNSGS